MAQYQPTCSVVSEFRIAVALLFWLIIFMWNVEMQLLWLLPGLMMCKSLVQFRDLEKGKTLVNWTYTVHPVATQTREQFTTFMTGFYLYNLNILQSAANARASSLNPAQEQIHRNSAPTCKLLNA